MNEQTKGKILYDSFPIITELNKVPNFDPRRFIKKMISPLTKKPVYDMELKYKNLWLRLKYPQAKVNPVVLKITGQVAIVEARVFFNLNDTESVSRYTATTSREADGPDYIKTAQYIACDQALNAAGFGCQFCDLRPEFTPAVTSAPVSENKPETAAVSNVAAVSDNGVSSVDTDNSEIANDISDISPQPFDRQPENKPSETVTSEETNQPEDVPEETAAPEENEQSVLPDSEMAEPDSTGQTEEIPQETDVTEVAGTQFVQATDQANMVEEIASADETPETQPQENSAPVSRFTPDMSVDEILASMTLEEAEAVVVDFGVRNGKTLGEIAKQWPASLKFYRCGYTGDRTDMIAGATLILERCFENSAAA